MKRWLRITSASVSGSRPDSNMANTQDQPSEVEAAKGAVTIDGPGGVVVTLTPEAAEKTSERLKKAARAARQDPESR